jgi:hypothetical protein
VYWNYKDKYASNPIIDILRDRAYEHRVQMLPFRGHERFDWLRELYSIEWVQHLFQYYNIQCLDVIQAPRDASDNVAFKAALASSSPHNLLRLWQLTNTRYLLGMGGPVVDALNQQLDPTQRRFRLHTGFELAPKGTNATRATELTAVLATNGSLALLEFTGALPRAKLYTQWQVITDGQAALQVLTNAGFNPAQTVIVADASVAPSTNSTNTPGGAVEFVSYAPKKLELKANATVPSILLLNDKFDANWKVRVDGKEESLLRCNFLMRGVQVPAGEHRIGFSYEPPNTGFFVSLGAVAIALGLCGVAAWWPSKAIPPPAATPPDGKSKRKLEPVNPT